MMVANCSKCAIFALQMVLMSTRSQRFSGTVITFTPDSAFLADAAGSTRFAVTTSEDGVSGEGKT